MTWNDQFLKLFRASVEKYRGGNDDFHSYYEPDDISFLASIGYKPRELFDFVERATALLASLGTDFLTSNQLGFAPFLGRTT